MSAKEGVAVGLPDAFCLCAKCGKELRKIPVAKVPPFPMEAMAILNNLDCLLLLRRTGKLTYRIVGWR